MKNRIVENDIPQLLSDYEEDAPIISFRCSRCDWRKYPDRGPFEGLWYALIVKIDNKIMMLSAQFTSCKWKLYDKELEEKVNSLDMFYYMTIQPRNEVLREIVSAFNEE